MSLATGYRKIYQLVEKNFNKLEEIINKPNNNENELYGPDNNRVLEIIGLESELFALANKRTRMTMADFNECAKLLNKMEALAMEMIDPDFRAWMLEVISDYNKELGINKDYNKNLTEIINDYGKENDKNIDKEKDENERNGKDGGLGL